VFFKDTYSKNSTSPVLQLFESVRTERGPRARLIVSLGTKFLISKTDRKEVARIVRERLSGQASLLVNDSKLLQYADYVVKKIGYQRNPRQFWYIFICKIRLQIIICYQEIANLLSSMKMVPR
jgi:hypothetical protein